VEQYLRFEHARFGERLRVEFDIDPRARLALVPVLSVQPLVENAIFHGLGPKGGGGRVRISARPGDDELTEIAVSDDGVGFVPGAPSQGMGIGIDNVNQRLTKLFGPASALQVESAPGRGATVTFRVPAGVRHRRADARQRAMLKVLVVDDEPLVRSELVYALGKVAPDFAVTEAGDAVEALQLLGRIGYDIAFLDINLPGLSGPRHATRSSPRCRRRRRSSSSPPTIHAPSTRSNSPRSTTW